MEALFECTLEMLNKDLEEFPEHRLHFFRMLQSFTQHCFPGEFSRGGYNILSLFSLYLALLQIPAERFKLYIDSVIWAFKHTMRNVAEIGQYFDHYPMHNITLTLYIYNLQYNNVLIYK